MVTLEIFITHAMGVLNFASTVVPHSFPYMFDTISEETKLLAQNGSIPKSTLNVNVGGRSAHIPEELKFQLKLRHKDGRLAKFCSQSHNERIGECDAYFESTREYYFERSSDIFEYIIDFYINGRLHRPMDMCPIRVKSELEFWKIPSEFVSECCQFDIDHMASFTLSPQQSIADQCCEVACLPFKDVWLGKQRFAVWNFLENPRSSLSAKFFSLLSAFFVLLSLAVLILSSMPELHDENQEPHWILVQTEISCMVWFTLEYILRFVINPTKYNFIKSPLNIIDLLTIVPFYVELCMPLIGLAHRMELRNLRGAMIVIRVTRLARVARIFKLARYSTGLRAFGKTMKKSAAELSMLGMFLLTGIMLFSTAIYFFERDEPNSKFYSIPAACWWCVITMTTVGYGDLVPATAGGKVVAAIASVCGIIVLAFPISMIIDKFAESTALCGEEDNRRASSVEFVKVKRRAKRGFF